MRNLLVFILLACCLPAVVVAQSYSSFTATQAKRLIAHDRDVVRQGFADGNWLSNRMIFYTVDGCTKPGFDKPGAQAQCYVCSIDDIGRAVSDNPNFFYRGTPLPSNAVALTSSVAFFRYFEHGGWKLVSFDPNGTNYIAQNGHPYLSADIPNLKKILPTECREMRSMSEVTVRGRFDD
ncbi:MAG: hypothetical protein ACWA5L_06075 [bacterium]